MIHTSTKPNTNITISTSTNQINFNTTEKNDISANISAVSSNYNNLINKPSINGVKLVGNKTTADLLIDQDFVKDDNYIHTDNNFTNALKEKLENFSEIQISNSEPTDTNIKLWYQIDSDEGGDING